MLLFCILLTNCANEKAPEGGKKDTAPPKPRQMSPPNKSLHFSSNLIKITFDEYIKATGFAQTLISPPLEKRPDFKISGKTLIIKLKSPLRDSTTYTINFAEDIKDVNEGNTLNNFNYVFSTGSFIDSQKVSGKVILAQDNSTPDGAIVSLYPEDSVNAVKRTKPFYFAKADKGGNFQINNIKAGKYQIFALKDQNYDYMYNQPNEMIAFSDTAIYLHDSIAPKIQLNLFQEKSSKTKFAGTRFVKTGYVKIYYSNPVKTLKVSSSSATDNDFYYFDKTKDTINYWYSNYYEKRIKLFLVANDTLFDTARIELQNIAKDSIFTKSKYLLQIENQANTTPYNTPNTEIINTQDLFKPLKITFTRPISDINAAKAFHLYEDSVKKDVIVKFTIDPNTKRSIEFQFDKKENTNYTLEVPDSAYQDIFGTWNIRFKYKFKTTSKDNYGNLNAIIKPHDSKDYIVKILDASNETLIRQIIVSHGEEKKVLIENVPAGNYKVVVVEDGNGNGEWDTGNFKTKTQPEKVISFKDTYTLKGGWDLDMEIKF